MKMNNDEVAGAVIASIAWSMAVTLMAIAWKGTHDVGYAQYGSKGHACFANHTCRENLKCMVADGIDPTCVKP